MSPPASLPDPVAHWKFDGDCLDDRGKHHGEGRGLVYAVGVNGRPEGAGVFQGELIRVSVPDHPALNFGVADFTFTAWVKPVDGVETAPGDILSKFDAPSRKGLSFGITTSSPGYSSRSDTRNLHLSLDDGTEPKWTDCGKPWPSNTLVGTLVAYEGELYTGIADATDPRDACKVFKYAGGTNWIDCGRLGDDPRTLSIFSIVVHKGELYGGAGVYNWATSNKAYGTLNHVYRYRGGKDWEDCGSFGGGFRVLSLASLGGELYASDATGECYRYLGRTRWEYCGRVDAERRMLHCFGIWRGKLYGGYGSIFRYDGGTIWTEVGKNPHGVTQTHCVQVYQGDLYIGTWPHGKVLKYAGGSEWIDCGQMGISTDVYQINEINDLTIYNGKLYAGVLPHAEVYRYEDGGRWTLLKSLVENPEFDPKDSYSWNRVPCMTVFDGKLYAGTSTCYGEARSNPIADIGRVVALETGSCVTYDRDIGSRWRHVAGVRENGRLRLYLDGNLAAESSPTRSPALNVSNTQPLLIGFGAQNYFSGAIDDLRIYDRALNPGQLKSVAQAALEG